MLKVCFVCMGRQSILFKDSKTMIFGRNLLSIAYPPLPWWDLVWNNLMEFYQCVLVLPYEYLMDEYTLLIQTCQTKSFFFKLFHEYRDVHLMIVRLLLFVWVEWWEPPPCRLFCPLKALRLVYRFTCTCLRRVMIVKSQNEWLFDHYSEFSMTCGMNSSGSLAFK